MTPRSVSTHTSLLAAALLLPLLCLAGCKKTPPPPSAADAPPPVPPAQPTVESFATGNPTSVVVSVNGVALTQAEADAEMARAMADPRMASVPPQYAQQMRTQMLQQVVDRFVNRQVLSAEINRQNISVEAADVEKAKADIVAKLPPGMTVEAALASSGMTEADFQKNLTEDLRVRKLLDSQLTNSAPATAEEIAAFYNSHTNAFDVKESVHARHVLVACDESATAEARAEKRKLADTYHAQLMAGTNFEALAKEHSDCPSGQRGGDLGTFGRGQMVGAFEDAAFAQATNAVGPVVETQFGYHIIQVLGRESARTKPLDEVRSDIAEYLASQQKQAAIGAYLDALKAKATVTYGP